MANTLSAAAVLVLETADPAQKAEAAHAMARAWRDGDITGIGETVPPARPARLTRPELRPPRDMPRRGKARSVAGRTALLHALAHIELTAIDLACDLIARFPTPPLPRAFYDDWVRVADEEALHFTLLSERLAEVGGSYGDLPAHDGLWEAATETAHDLAARLAIVPLVLEARGLDVTPPMIKNLRNADDEASAVILERIYSDEIGHVAAGKRWFDWVCHQRGTDPHDEWRTLVVRHFRGVLKPPFNHAARAQAGLFSQDYENLPPR